MKEENYKTIKYWKIETITVNNCKIVHCFKTGNEAADFITKNKGQIKDYKVKVIIRTIIELNWRY